MLSLLWFIAVTLLVVTWQLSVSLQVAMLLMTAACLWFAGRYHHQQMELRPEAAYLQSERFGTQEGLPITLLYHTPFWLVVKVQYHDLPFKQRLWLICNRYQLIYRDQFTQADYRMIKSRLCVEQFMTETTQKNESEVSK